MNDKGNNNTEIDDIEFDDSILIEDESNDLEDSNLSDMKDSNSNGQRTSKKHKKKITPGNIIRYLIMGIALIVFIYSGTMLAKIYLEYKKGEDIYKSIESSVLSPVETKANEPNENADDSQLPFKYDHQALLNINPEGIGYLYVPSINLRLPMVQGTDNDYYLTHTFNKNYNGSGALFEDSRIKGGLSSSHVIIYGHNMKNGSMFAGLNKYLNQPFYNTSGNDVFYIYTQNKVMEYKIFSAYISEPISDTYTYNFGSLDAMRQYAKSMKTHSNYDMGVDLSSATQIVTFSTCTSDGADRVIVQGMYVGETPLN